MCFILGVDYFDVQVMKIELADLGRNAVSSVRSTFVHLGIWFPEVVAADVGYSCWLLS